MLLLRPDRQHPFPVLVPQTGCRRVIHARRLVPVAGAREQFLEEFRCVGGVGLRIEGYFQAGERVRMVHQIDLPAADIDRPDPVGLHGTDGGHSLGLGSVEQPLSLGVHGPRPRVHRAGGRIAPAAFHAADRSQQMGRQAAAPLGGGDRRATQKSLGKGRGERRLDSGGTANCHHKRKREAKTTHRRDCRSQALPKGCRPSLERRWEIRAKRCCDAKYRLHANDRSPTLCIAAMRSLTALSAFLDVSSLNLAAPQASPFFCARLSPRSGCGRSRPSRR